MPSRNNPDSIDFARGVITTAEDTEFLLRVRQLNRLDPWSYLEFLRSFAERHPPSREIPPRHEPFRL
jgi:hypothetical protein